jgi:NitT/TauT family transport system ATP-binding protein
MKLIIGYIRLIDCAGLVAAAERGFAADEGLELSLVPESAWATIRDRLLVGHFDAAHVLAPMTVASSLGVGHLRVPLIAPFALGLGGNAITASCSLWEQMLAEGAAAGASPASQGHALSKVVAARSRAGLAPLTLGMVYPFSCHNYELRYWLAASGVDPDRDVQLVVIPPPFLADALRAGQIDGFCVGEPWSSVAVSVGAGVIVTPTTAIWPRSPEKVLGCRAEWAARHPEELAALLRALYRASLWCGNASNHAELAQLLAAPRYLGMSAELIHRVLAGNLVLTPGAEPTELPGFYVPGGVDASFPWVSHALWFHAQMVRWGQLRSSPDDVAVVRATYRPDLYRSALAPLGADIPAEDMKVEHFFDGQIFDPAVIRD